MANEEGPQEDLAQVGLLGHDDAHVVGGDPKNASRDAHPGSQEDALSRQQAYFAQEFPGSVVDDQRLVGRAELVDDLDPALEDHNQVVGLVAV